jgi:hypothetical protein
VKGPVATGKKRRKKNGSSLTQAPAAHRAPALPAAAERPRRRLPPRVEALLDRVPFLARWRTPRFTRAEALGSVPFRNELIEWEMREEGGGENSTPVAVLRVPRRQDRWGRLLNRFFEGPSHRQVVLDELGTDVWQMCDGETSVEGLIRALARKHKLERREVEISLTTYLQTLARRGFIGIRIAGHPENGESLRRG